MRRYRPPYCRHAGAFTLMELLVVIAIIGGLAALSAPVYQRVMHRARAAHCMTNLRGLGTALHLYIGENNNQMPTMVLARENKDSDEAALDNTLLPYVDGPEVFCCKADDRGLCKTTGTSYMWNNLLNGQNVASLDFMGIAHQGARIPVISDKENFHKYRDVEVNILYADGHVAKEIQFTTNDE